MLFDDILSELGEFGTYQKRIYLLGSLYSIPWAFHAIASVFLAAQTDHWCSPNPDVEYFANCSSSGAFEGPDMLGQCGSAIWKNLTIPSNFVDGKLVYDQCQRFDQSSVGTLVRQYEENQTIEFDDVFNVTSSAEPCGQSGWSYDRSQYTSTVIQDVSIESQLLLSLSFVMYLCMLLYRPTAVNKKIRSSFTL